MRLIWKFVLRNPDANVVDMPLGARVVHADLQDGYPCIWAEVDPVADKLPRVFHIYPTGIPVVDGDVYVGTVRVPDVSARNFAYFWHIYERMN